MLFKDDRLEAGPTNGLLQVTVLALLTVCMSQLSADELSPKEKDLFEIHVRPTLVVHCIKCHGDAKQEGGLRLTSLADMLKGGESGPAIVPGKPDESLLLEALRYESLEMPPEGELDSQLVDGIETWIASGAAWPKGTVLKPLTKITEKDRQWWCFQPIADPAVPEVDDEGWCRNEIDRFIFARLAKDGIRPTADAEPLKLMRRVHFAVTGLPPDSAVVRSANQTIDRGAINDNPNYESLVDRLLDDPAYGENQARYWLDLVRYAETDGYRADGARPEAHRYRDYVIKSFNDDKPYDRFVTEQLAGDEVDPGNRDALVATMYLRHWIYEWNQRDVELQWEEILNDITETTADVFLAQGLKCARCHDHKFDPLLQKDYFRLRAFFAAFQPRENLPVADLATRAAHFNQQRKWEEATAQIRQRLHEIETPVLLKHSTREGVDKFVTEIRSMIAKPAAERKPFEHQIATLASRQFDLHPDKLPEWLDKETEAERQQLRERLAKFDSMKPAPLPTLSFVSSDVGPIAPPTFIPDDPKMTPIAPGFPTILDDKPAKVIPPPVALQSTGRRTALARWITDPANPFTARVIVNRVWQQHFGRGLVETASDFGHLGEPPIHPELLDWLACRFIEDGWSIKKLHRRILTSATWRQSSQRPMDDHLLTLDPGNRLLWRMNSRRLSGEEITDAILSASGELKSKRRAIYKPVQRNSPDPLLGLFDLPDRIRSQDKRHHTTTSTQALMLMNNPWAHARAAAIAKSKRSSNDQELIEQVYQHLFFRPPTDEEYSFAKEFLDSYETASPSVNARKLISTMPSGERAIDLRPAEPTSIRVPWSEKLPNEEFTIEAIVLLRSLYPDATVRTIAAHWTGSTKHSGWALGVTSTKSAYKPRNLILQLVGSNGEGQTEYEVVASDLRLELNTPYHVAVSVNLSDLSKNGVTFFLKDLSAKETKAQVAHVSHKVTSNIRPEHELDIGGRFQTHLWDGLIQNVRLYPTALNVDQIAADAMQKPLLDITFADEVRLGVDSSGNNHHARVDSRPAKTDTPREQARITLVHALLNSNELIYVD